jgi:predicted dehydrogenase
MNPKSKAKCLSRRTFLKIIPGVSATALILPNTVLSLNGSASPNNKINFGIIGFGNRAKYILPNFLGIDDLRIVAVSDPRQDRLADGKQSIDAFYRNKDCRIYKDFRELLDQQDIDAVYIATGNRWHGLASIYAARAGKDIYSEKPVTLTIKEGRELVNTCKRFGTVYQAGTQRRSTGSYRFAVQMIREGKLGNLKTVEMQVWTGPAIPHDKPAPVPQGWDYDLWLGQVPWRPFVPARVFNWQYFWDTAEGIMTDMGCHYTDLMQFALNTDHTGPVEFEATAEFPDPKQFMSDTPITAQAVCKYANGVQGVMYQRKGFTDRYIKFICDEGWIQIDDETDKISAEPASILKLYNTTGQGWSDAGAHIKDLINCIRNRTLTICHPEAAHRAMSICQAWTICLRTGQKLYWDPIKEKFDSPEANRLLWREPRAPWRI